MSDEKIEEKVEENKTEENSENQAEVKPEEPKEIKPSGLASFLERAVASYFDFTILYVIYFIAEIAIIKPFFGRPIFSHCYDLFTSPSHYSKILSSFFIILAALYVILILVSIFLENTKQAAGFGKRLVGIYVLDEHLKPIKFSKALIRNLSKLLSLSVLALGFALYFLNEKKQTLHDIIANTVIVRKSKMDANKVTVMFAISFLITIAAMFTLHLLIPGPSLKELSPKRAVEVIPAAKGFIQEGDSTIKLKDSIAVLDPLRGMIEVYAAQASFNEEQIQELTNKYSESIPNYVDFKILMKLKPDSLKCSEDSFDDVQYFISGKSAGPSENKPEITEMRGELINDSHFFARFYRKKSELTTEKNWEVQLSSKLKIRREKAKLTFDSESVDNSLAIWNHSKDKNSVEVGFFSEKLTKAEITEIRKAKGFTEHKPLVIVTFDLQLTSEDLNVATVTKYGVSFNRVGNINFPGKQDRVDFYYVPSVTENLQLAKLSGRLSEGERITGYLNHQANKVIAEVDFDVDWDVTFNLPLIDLEQEGNALLADSTANTETKANPSEKSCKFKADQSELVGVDSVALYYPEEGDVVVGVFNEPLTAQDKEEFRKKKSIWINVNGKVANFVVFFDLKRESKSFTRELLLEYNVNFVRDNYGRLYFPGNSDRAQFTCKELEFTPEEISGLTGVLQEGSEISFKLKKKKESKLSGLQFSWDCYSSAKLLVIQ